MDCPSCKGTGEIKASEEHESVLTKEKLKLVKECGAWPYTCPRCGGTGYFED